MREIDFFVELHFHILLKQDIICCRDRYIRRIRKIEGELKAKEEGRNRKDECRAIEKRNTEEEVRRQRHRLMDKGLH